ncbi:DUF2949 domain-containing protein [Candidatus Synechococcus calcipolaris G9]|uniref:DUF2949 domain-containing protein n=1 Tax=Candidatus Synechococcus calcipolaris G9 TaxID=1497997 RepID=A0ABT6EZ58_9SYNE|nr:DUF2949 domain-containing protein [Candidatus Synechococcus calcipolaris]MDG2990710.1 DUF2949 domain-containing protein [Candidatus Synechococcus calcipolaris G9]
MREPTQLVDYLEQELSLAPATIQMALKQWQEHRGPLPIILWQYGFITLEQLDKIFDFIETKER